MPIHQYAFFLHHRKKKQKAGEKWYEGSQFDSPMRKQFAARSWTTVMSPSIKDAMTPAEVTRQEATFEFTDSEKKYSNLLEHIIRVYCISMTSGAEQLLSDDEAEVIFSNLKAICHIHKSDPADGAAHGTTLHDGLAAARTGYGVANPGAIFSEWCESRQPHVLYGEYCTNLALSKHTLKVQSNFPILPFSGSLPSSLPFPYFFLKWRGCRLPACHCTAT
jgi:hypothetical protein